MDKAALVLRNRRMAEAFHAVPYKHHLRREILRFISHLPIQPALSKSERILLIRPDHLGDMLLTTPAIRALRAARPSAEIHALVGGWSADVLANIAEIDVVLTLDFPGFNRKSMGQDPLSPYRQLVRVSRQLRHIGYSSVVILRRDHWWGALLAFLAGIPDRIGYNLPELAPFLTQAIEPHEEHAVLQSLRLVEFWTEHLPSDEIIFQYAVKDSDKGYVDDYLANWGITPDQRILCIHPGSGSWVKLWQEEKWASVADTLVEQLDAAIVFTGGEHESAMVHRIASYMRHNPCLMVGDTRIGQLAALYARSGVVLGPDSGPLHLAAAVGAPTVTLFGPADPVEFGPWGAQDKHIIITADIACRPCRVLNWGDDNPQYHPCMRDITMGQILNAARRVAI